MKIPRVIIYISKMTALIITADFLTISSIELLDNEILSIPFSIGLGAKAAMYLTYYIMFKVYVNRCEEKNE